MAKGDGTIINRGRNKWQVAIDFGTNPLTGKRERVSKRVNGTKEKARRVRDQIRQDHDNGLTIDAEKITFAEYAEKWQQSQETAAGLSSRTIADNKRIIRHLTGYIGDMKLKNITSNVVESLYTQLKQDRNFSGTTMLKYHTKLKQILKHAVNHDFILRNPCERVTAPKKNEVNRRSLTSDEAVQLLLCLDSSEAAEYDALKDKASRETHWCTDGISHHTGKPRRAIRGVHDLSNIMAARIGLATGMRLGEVLALTWDCVDLTAKKIKVKESLTLFGEINKPKSKAGIRTISIDTKTCIHLTNWKTEQARSLKKIDIVQSIKTPVCCSDIGGYSDLRNYERWWNKWSNANNFEGLRFHELRHTQATQLLANGIDIKTVQTRLGHADASLTLNTYAHAIPENDEAAAELIGNLITNKKEARIIDFKTA